MSDWNYILRLSGEIGLKSDHTRKRFNQKLKENIESALSRQSVDFQLSINLSRFDVQSPNPELVNLLSRIPGIQGVIKAVGIEWSDLDDVVEKGKELFADVVGGHTFAVRATRVGPRDPFPFTSVDVERELGQKLVDEGGQVDLDNPEVSVGVEIRKDRAYFYSTQVSGPGGLPIGTQRRGLSLISGGFDSAIATWLMAKRGTELDFVFFNLAGPSHEKHVRQVTKEIAEKRLHGYRPELYVIDFRPVIAELKQKVSGGYWQLLLKRIMMRAASMLAQRKEYPFVVTGESAGQVSSQTMANLAAIEKPIDIPIIRPLIGMNKTDITEIARRIETFDVSAGTPEFCALKGGRPVTQGKARDLNRREQKLGDGLIDLMVRQARRLEVLEMDRWDEISIEIDEIPENSAVVDLRDGIGEEDLLDSDFIDLPFQKAMEYYETLPRGRPYVLCCRVGLKSAHLAEKMQAAGFEAYSFEGGIPALREYLGK